VSAPQRPESQRRGARLLAETLDVSRRDLELAAGHSSRDKVVAVRGMSADAAETRLAGSGGRGMSSGLDLERFRGLLESERDRLQHAVQTVHHDGSLLEETGDLAIGSGDHIADSASETYMRELDEGLEENAEHLLEEIESALERIDEGRTGCAASAAGLSIASG